MLALTCATLGVQRAPTSGAAPFTTDMPLSALQQQEKTVEDLFLRATPSVVYINTYISGTNRITMNAVEVPRGTGSGFIWDKEGHVVTNYHVIKGANGAKVGITTATGTSVYDSTLVGYNPDKDVAVLKINDYTGPLKPLAVGCSSTLRVGQTTLAIGNPFGLDHSLTLGVVSGLGREVMSPTGRPITNVIQTDAAINPGNSGGALLDSSGNLIGMNTAIYSPSGASAGIGFAIPVDTLKQQVPNIIKNGKVLRPTIGISYMQGAQARALGVNRGVLVLGVPADSNAARAGLRGSSRDQRTGQMIMGDVIIGIDNNSIDSDTDLFKVLDQYEPGQRVKIVVRRQTGQGEFATEQTVTLTSVLGGSEAA